MLLTLQSVSALILTKADLCINTKKAESDAGFCGSDSAELEFTL